jgi:hypothetical protein
VGGGHVPREGLGQEPGRGLQEGPGHRAADVVDHHVDAAERGPGRLGQPGDGVEVGQVGGDHLGPPARRGDPGRHLGELLGRARRQQHVGPGLGQGHGGGGADAPPGTGDDGGPIGQQESVEDHGAALFPLGSAVRAHRRGGGRLRRI